MGRRGVMENGVPIEGVLLGFVHSIDGIDTLLLQSRVQDDCLDFNLENADVISMRKFGVKMNPTKKVKLLLPSCWWGIYIKM